MNIYSFLPSRRSIWIETLLPNSVKRFINRLKILLEIYLVGMNRSKRGTETEIKRLKWFLSTKAYEMINELIGLTHRWHCNGPWK